MTKALEKIKLGQVCQVIAGQSPEGKYYNTEGIGTPFYQGKKNFSEKFIEPPTTWTTDVTKVALKDDILMSVRAPVGPINFSTSDICIGRGLAAIRSNQRIDKDFLFYQLLYLQPRIAGNEGAVFASINKSQIESIPIVIGEPTEQKRIVNILDESFSAIDIAKANTEKNLQNARALFESYLQVIFSNSTDNWVQRKIGDNTLLEIIDGDRGANYPKKTDFHEQEFCLFLNTKNVRQYGFDFKSNMFITKEKDSQLRKGKLKRNDIVLTTRGTIGNIGFYSDEIDFDNIRINSGMLILRVNEKQILPAYLFEILHSNIVKSQIVKYTTGAAQPQLPIKTLVNFNIPVPKSLEKQQYIVNSIKDFYIETQRVESTYQKKLAALEELKKSLLHQAFNGGL